MDYYWAASLAGQNGVVNEIESHRRSLNNVWEHIWGTQDIRIVKLCFAGI